MNPISLHTLSSKIKLKAKEIGFDFCGISKSGFLEEEAPRLESWLKANNNGKMAYMENHFDKRLDTTLLVEGSKSVISLLYNYYPPEQLPNADLKISKYAYGLDYHEVIKKKIVQIWDFMTITIGAIEGRIFVDSAPVMEKAWAKKSGLGWIGKNSNLITKQSGSFFFLAEIIVDVELEYDSAIKDFCGTCTRCIDACPTDAIIEPYVVDGSKCISYLTIELKDDLPKSFQSKMDGWIFGCDICQDVCPWNRFSKPHFESDFNITPDLLKHHLSEWKELDEEVFKIVFKGSAVKRTKFNGFNRNISFVKLNNKK